MQWIDFKTQHRLASGATGNGDRAVLMIGGGGKECQRADHGIGITETNKASLMGQKGQTKYDFGDNGRSGATYNKTYSLNLWVN